MAAPREAQVEIHDALVEHFYRTSHKLLPEQISEMTALSLDEVRNALRVLHESRRIQGVTVAEVDFPLILTGVAHD